VPSPRSTVILVLSLALLSGFAVATAAASPGSDDPTASAAATCRLSSSKQRSLGPTYVTALSVSGTSCATGERVVRAYYRCRVRNGGRRGRCTSRVLGYRCTETRESISTQFDARVRCRYGARRVNHSYTQFT
jgi:hypothetical protein